MFLYIFSDVHVRVSRVGDVHNGQFDLGLIALDCCGDHPFGDVLCLNDLSFPPLVQEYTNSKLLSEATSNYIYICGHIFESQISFCSCLQVSHRRTASHSQPSISLRISSNRYPLVKHFRVFCFTSKDVSE